MVATSALLASGVDHDVTVSIALGSQHQNNNIYPSTGVHTARVVLKVPIPASYHPIPPDTPPKHQHQAQATPAGDTRAPEALFTQQAREFLEHAQSLLRQLEQRAHETRMAISTCRETDPGTAIAVAYADHMIARRQRKDDPELRRLYALYSQLHDLV